MRMLVVAAAALAAVGLTGCGGESRPCLEGHTETTLMPIYVNNNVMLIPQDTFVCDKYATLSRNP